jgi:hypothetical protein
MRGLRILRELTVLKLVLLQSVLTIGIDLPRHGSNDSIVMGQFRKTQAICRYGASTKIIGCWQTRSQHDAIMEWGLLNNFQSLFKHLPQLDCFI